MFGTIASLLYLVLPVVTDQFERNSRAITRRNQGILITILRNKTPLGPRKNNRK